MSCRGGGILYRDFSAGENSAWEKFRTCPKKSRGKFRTSQLFSALEAKGILGLQSPKDTHYNKATINDSADV